jgi:ribosomal-protein-alanine N-acetyltransferase
MPMQGDAPISIMDIHAAAAPVIAALTETGGGETWSAQSVAGILGLPGAFGLLALRQHTPVGFLMAQCAVDESEIVNLVVDPDCRRKGLGGALLDAAMQRARLQGARSMFLEVASDNTAARALYESRGFGKVGLRPDYYRKGRVNYIDALILRCDLITNWNDGC